MARQLSSDGPLDLGSLLVGHPPAIDQQVGQRLRRLRDPVCTGLREIVGVNRPALECDNAEEEIELGVHHGLIFPSTPVETIHRFESGSAIAKRNAARDATRTIPFTTEGSPNAAPSPLGHEHSHTSRV